MWWTILKTAFGEWSRHRTGRLGTSIVAHMAFNTVTIVALLVQR